MTDARVPNIEAERWIKPLSCLDPGAKLTLAALWSFAPFGVSTHASSRDVFPSRRLLAEETGQTLEAVKRQLMRLSSAGWIERDREGWNLRWREAQPTPVTTVPARVPESPGTTVADPGDYSGRPPATTDPGPGTTVTGSGDHSDHGSEGHDQSSDRTKERTSARPSRFPPQADPDLRPAPASPEPRAPAAEREATKRENARKVQQAAATMREQFPDRAAPKPGKCPLELWAVVESHPASRTYAVDVHGNWAAKLGQLAAERSLTPDELAGLLDFWESERAKFATPRDRDAALDSGAFPPMTDLWFFKSIAWVRWAIAVVRTPAGEAPPKRPSATTKPTQHNPALPNSTPYFAALRASGRDFAEGEGPEVDDIPF